MVLIDRKCNPRAAYEFLAEIILWDQENCEKQLKNSYQPVINTQTTRQSCKIIHEPENEEEKPLLVLSKKVSKSIDSKKTQHFDKESSVINRREFKVNENGEKKKKFFFKYSKEFNEEYKQNTQINEKKEDKNKKKNNCITTILPNKKNILRLRFMYFPEYILVGQKLLINDSSLKAIGWIKEIFY